MATIQEGISIRDFLTVMGTKAGRVALFGIPLQQQWSYRVDGDHAPTYYLNSDAPLYYYSFTDAWIAMAYKSLPRDQQARSRGTDRRRSRSVLYPPRSSRARQSRRGRLRPGE